MFVYLEPMGTDRVVKLPGQVGQYTEKGMTTLTVQVKLQRRLQLPTTYAIARHQGHAARPLAHLKQDHQDRCALCAASGSLGVAGAQLCSQGEGEGSM